MVAHMFTSTQKVQSSNICRESVFTALIVVHFIFHLLLRTYHYVRLLRRRTLRPAVPYGTVPRMFIEVIVDFLIRGSDCGPGPLSRTASSVFVLPFPFRPLQRRSGHLLRSVHLFVAVRRTLAQNHYIRDTSRVLTGHR